MVGPRRRVSRANYFARVHSLCCLGCDSFSASGPRIERATGELWLRDSLGIEGGHVEKLARERTVALLQLTAEEILLGDQEEPVYRTVGMVGRLVLNLLAQPRDLMGNILSEGAEQKLMELAGTMKDVKYQIGPLGTLSRLYLWPIDVLLDKLGGDESGDAKKGLAATFMESFSSPLWVARGRAAGSWSFDDQNTYVIASSLTTFWRHALAAENREAFAKVFECLGQPSSTALLLQLRKILLPILAGTPFVGSVAHLFGATQLDAADLAGDRF